MRVSREVAAKNRENVVEVAARLFREHGYDGIGLAGLMKAAGLTHGGFYKQFDSKEALAVESTAQALAGNLESWRKVMDAAPGDKLRAFVDWYLSNAHLDERAGGCTYAALAAEAPRQGEPMRRAYGQALERAIARLIGLCDGDSEDEKRKRAIRAVSLLVGSLILARAVDDRAFAEEILRSARA